MARSADADKKPGAVERALGHTAPTLAAPDVQKRFALIGVIASARGQGSALIAVDGQPAKTYLVGQELESGWKVKEVAPHLVVLQLRDSTIRISLPNSQKDG